MKDNKWARLLAYVTGLVNQRCSCRASTWLRRTGSSNRTTKTPRVDRSRAFDLGRDRQPTGSQSYKRGCDRRASRHHSCLVSAIIAKKLDGSKRRSYPERPPFSSEIERLIVRMDREHSGWGYDRIVGALANLGHKESDQTDAKIFRKYGLPPAPKRSGKTTWKELISPLMDVLTGVDFFTFRSSDMARTSHSLRSVFRQLETRRISLAGITRHPTEEGMVQVTRSMADAESGELRGQRYLLHDRDSKFYAAFQNVIHGAGIKPIKLPYKSPNLNAFAERLVRSVRRECLSKLILFGETPLRRALKEYAEHYHTERTHQGEENRVFPSPQARPTRPKQVFQCDQRLGDLLKYYREAA